MDPLEQPAEPATPAAPPPKGGASTDPETRKDSADRNEDRPILLEDVERHHAHLTLLLVGALVAQGVLVEL